MPDFDWTGVFQQQFTKAITQDVAKSGFTPDTWFTAGRGRGQGEDWWRENGPGFAQAFGNWWESERDAQIWIAPDGRPAVELELRVNLGGVNVVMFVDLIIKLGSALVVVDIKTSTKEPETNAQLGFYACGVELMYGIRPKYGTHFMCKGVGEPKKFFLPPSPLDEYRYSIPFFEKQMQMLDRADREGIYLANVGDHCQRCGVNYACDAVGGADAHKYRGEGV